MAVVSEPARTGTESITPVGWPRVLWATGTVLLSTMVFHIAALLITRGAVSGPVSLRKPATFAETTWLVAWAVALILPRIRTRAWQRHVIGTSVLLFGVGETAIMATQAWRGVPSHYNFSTPLDAALIRLGAGGTAGIFVIGTIVLLVATVRSRDTATSVRLGIVALLVGCAVGMGLLLVHAFRQLPLAQLHAPALATLALCAVVLLATYFTTASALLTHPRGAVIPKRQN